MTEILVVEVLVVTVALVAIGVGAVAGFIGKEGHSLCAKIRLTSGSP